MKVVYICHPYANDPCGNKKKANGIVDKILEDELLNRGDPSYVPVTPLSVFLALPPSMEESEKIDRRIVMEHCLSFLRKCDEIWVYSYGKAPTDGMIEEIEESSRLGIPIVWKSLDAH